MSSPFLIGRTTAARTACQARTTRTARRIAPTSLALLSTALLAACGGMPALSPFNQDTLPEAVRVPAGHRVALETVGIGQITYECRPKANASDAFEWVFAGPLADLNSRGGTKIGTYYGPPATWAASDGSAITGTQLAVAPGGIGNIPLQLVKANPSAAPGAMSGVTYIQRVDTRGGVAPAAPCGAANAGGRSIVKYQADYIFWKAV